MTNKDRLKSLLGFGPDNDSLEGTMTDYGIDGTATYTAGDSVVLKTAAIRIMELLLTTADTTNENGYKIVYDREAVLKRIALLKDELEIDVVPGPTITAKSYLW